jgi:serine/threonine protein kinase
MRIGGRYDVVGDLSSGGMGRLRLARATSGRLVVIKTPHNREDDERLRDEARVGMRLLHPHIVETLDLLDLEGRPGLVTAYVSGASLFDLRRKGLLPPMVVCRVGRQIAEALDAIHNACDEVGRPLKILHRDVTPSNIMLGHDGRARLIDLGIARSLESRAERTDAGSVRGTLRYLAPELFGNGEHSPQTDLWSLGVVLWEALRGKEAVKGTSAAAIGKIISGHIMALEPGERVDARMQRAIAQLLRLDAAQRPARAREAAAMFSMLEKELAGDRDVEQIAAACVIAAVGPSTDGVNDPNRVMARAQAVFGVEARLQTTGVADLEAIPQTLAETGPPLTLDETVDELPPLLETPLEAPLEADVTDPWPLQRTTTPSQALLSYTKMLKQLERR